MGRGGGAGGGSRGGGGGFHGGSRSSGGFRGGSSSHRGGYSGGGSSFGRGSSSGGGSSFGGSGRPPAGGNFYGGFRPTIINVGNNSRPAGGGYFNGGGSNRNGRKGKGGAGCLTAIVVGVFLMILLCVIFALASDGAEAGASTVDREKLDSQYVNTTAYYEDHAGWIGDPSELEAGLKSFYKETGVQPYLYITETVNGDPSPTDEEMDAFASALYDELFTDEGHLLVVFQEYHSDGNYFCWYVAGKQAKTVFDDEAAGIFNDYIDHYYYSDLSEEEFFSQAFEKTGERIMTVTRSPVGTIFVVIGVVALAALGFVWWQKAKAQKNKEAEHAQTILNTPIQDLGSQAKDPELEELEKKYQDD